MDARNAVVFGAGIGGLTAARALVDVGWRVTLLERAPVLEPVGSGVGLMPNALRGLDSVGVGDTVRGLAALGSGGVRRPDGRWLLRTDNEEVRARFGDAVVVLRRSDIVDILLRGLPDTVRTSTAVTGVQPGDDHGPARVATEQGELEADLVVAADGVSSTARGSLFPDHPGLEYSGATAWRVIGVPSGWEGDASETWGRGEVAGVMPLADGCVYAYFTALAPAGTHAPDERPQLRRRFGTWHAPIPGLIDAAEPDDVLRNDVWWLVEPLPALHRGRVAMLGDAAHPMAPNLGQGACQAIEDAVTLAHAVGPAGGSDVPAGLARYTAARLRRSTDVARRSARASAIVNSESRLRAGVRDLALATVDRIAPRVFYGAMRASVDWSPP